MWVILDKLRLKFLKYLLPILEVGLLFFMSELFLLPSVITFLLLIYDGRIFTDSIFKSYYNIDRKDFYIDFRLIVSTILIAPVLYALSYSLSYRLIEILNNLHISPFSFYEASNFTSKNQFISYVILFTSACIIAPIVEEFTFRVLIYRNWLSKVIKKRVVALLLSSLIFALSHFEINTLPYIFITGFILGIIYDAFGYVNAVVLHMILNIFSFIQVSGIVIYNKIAIIIYTVIVLISIILLNTSKKKAKRVKI
jgi:membrane protease YdiL (CAAX protease family)